MTTTERSAADGAAYSMRDIVRATGLSEHALRAWERRHRAIEPPRSRGGTRRYSSDDLARLVLLKRLVDRGERIGSIARLRNDELLARIADGAERAPHAAPYSTALEAVLRFDADASRSVLASELAERGPVAFARTIALPLLAEIGDRWHRGELSPAAEHLATSIVRSLLGAALGARERRPGQLAIVCATLQGEPHEVGLLAAAVMADAAGARVVYLGADLPPASIARAADVARAQVVLIAMTAAPEGEADEAVARLAQSLRPGTELWIGGAQARIPDGFPARILRDLDDFDRHLRMRHGPSEPPETARGSRNV